MYTALLPPYCDVQRNSKLTHTIIHTCTELTFYNVSACASNSSVNLLNNVYFFLFKSTMEGEQCLYYVNVEFVYHLTVLFVRDWFIHSDSCFLCEG